MSRSYWLSAITVIGLALLAALIWALKERHDQRENAYRSSYEQYQYTKGDQVPGAAIDGKRSVANPKSYREEWREEKDLQAQRDMSEWAFYMMVFSLGGVIVTAIGVVYIACTLRATRAAVEEARNMTRVAANTLRLMSDAERAYVTMSHEPPGLKFLEQSNPAAIDCPTFVIRVANYGRTPATVTDVHLQLDWFGKKNPPPNQPVYRIDEPRNRVGFFLVANNYFFHRDTQEIPERSGDDKLWLYGFVDYTDEFGQNHRGGYAREFTGDRITGTEGNNLIFVDKTGWNYDRIRTPDEENKTA